MPKQTPVRGSRVLIRDAEWRVRRVDSASYGGNALTCVGLSELVKDETAIFLEELEDIEIVDPAETQFVQDDSSNYRKSFLYLESLLKQTPPTDSDIYIGHKAAMDPLNFQLTPALRALKQHRQRIFIADAVGLGKTLEAGILVSELIKRGRGKRILCLTMKSMLTQFQKELWTRFTIPLVRLDSAGIQRIRKKIPANHNPFYYYDKSIISIDTLKHDNQYRTYIENCEWDIIIIDEAHNVAHRGSTKSQRFQLANLLADKSDTMIMLSATPHDGRPESFASLMKMLNSISIANEHNYDKDDIKGQFIRRYKKDIESQVQQKFKERDIHKVHVKSSQPEEKVFEKLAGLKFGQLDMQRSAGHLFRTTLEKALLSSPQACLETIQNRIKRSKEDDKLGYDLSILQDFADTLEKVDIENFSKYQKLLELLKYDMRFNWNPDQPDDRVVIFTERIRTMKFLKNQLQKDLDISQESIIELHGSMSDMEQQEVVEKFGNKQSPYRLLVASDVASEGINLHYQCNKLIHFDIPWSLMVFQQRNGRIDRYGQTRKPQIYYLMQESETSKIKADKRILELLIDKDQYAQKNIGDSSVFMDEYDIYAEESKTAQGIEEELDQEEFETKYLKNDQDLLDQLMGSSDDHSHETDIPDNSISEMPSLFSSDFQFVESCLQSLPDHLTRQYNIDEDENLITWTLPEELREFYQNLPDEIKPKNWEINLTNQTGKIQREIERSREDEETWPALDYLWELHPVVRWLVDKSLNQFGRKEAPVIELQQGLSPGEKIIVCSGTYPNRQGQPIFHRWCGIPFSRDNGIGELLNFENLVGRLKLNSRKIPNPNNQINTEELQDLLEPALDNALEWLDEQRSEFEDVLDKKLQNHLDELNKYRDRQLKQLSIRFEKDSYLDKKEKEYNKMMDEYIEYVEKTLIINKEPHIQVVAGFVGQNHN